WPGSKPRKADTETAKNYLNNEELDILNRIVSMYLDFAELQALNRSPMYMQDWILKLDEFLRLSGRDVLEHSGKISHEKALHKARLEYEKWHLTELEKPSLADKHFVEAMNEAKQLSQQSKPKRKK
ncbi:MAG: RhuM family protein, partial [Candidatus Cloacimonadaceae bacterium]|nr:RhuM family protein [Candidatus Cloacimonadaceae bacterium]